MGSLVEICVKFVKRIIYGSIRNNVICYHDFVLLVQQIINIVNKRAIAYKEALRDDDSNDLPCVITPELLCKGRELVSVNVVPALQPDPDDSDWTPSVGSGDGLRRQFAKTRKVFGNLVETYNSVFKQTLIDQAVASKANFHPVSHTSINVGDIVLLVDPLLKANNYPMARVTSVIKNALGEVTNIVAKKGSTRELVKRHVSSVIPLLRLDSNEELLSPTVDGADESQIRSRPQRTAAVASRLKTAQLVQQNLA